MSSSDKEKIREDVQDAMAEEEEGNYFYSKQCLKCYCLVFNAADAIELLIIHLCVLGCVCVCVCVFFPL